MEKPAVVWIRNDLRLHDNPALFEAVTRRKRVVLLYIYDTSVTTVALGGASRVWLGKSLEYFGEKVRDRGFGWVVREGKPLEVLREVLKELGSEQIFWNRRYEYEGVQQDAEIEEMLSMDGVFVHTFQGNILVEPWALMTKKGTPFKVFTPFFQAFNEVEKGTCEAPEVTPSIPLGYTLSSQRLSLFPKHLEWPIHVLETWKVGEEAALERLKLFCLEGLANYGEKRDFPGIDGTSKISPYLHFGQLSPRRVWNMVLDYGRKARRCIGEAFLRELVWREFSSYCLYHFPKMVWSPFKENTMRWRNDAAELCLWTRGKTGIPIVDAGMRQLWEEGWMHNRVRMITASFLVKHLLHSWREGEQWFWDTLLDADRACNTYNWQNVAGCGAGAMPFFRILNPVVQSQRFDREGTYIKRFVPELRNIPVQYIHAPWKAPTEDLFSWGVSLGENYPWPMVDLDAGRKRALDAFRGVS